MLRHVGEPWVVFGPVMPEDPNLFIGSDNEGGSHAAVEHLIRLGRKRILFLGEASERHSEFFERYKGYLRAHAEAGIAPDPALAVDCFISREEGAAAVERLLEEGVAFDAVFAVTDLLAIGAIQSLQKRGLHVPKDVSVMGFDDLWACTCINPSLSTVHQDTSAAGAGPGRYARQPDRRRAGGAHTHTDAAGHSRVVRGWLSRPDGLQIAVSLRYDAHVLKYAALRFSRTSNFRRIMTAYRLREKEGLCRSPCGCDYTLTFYAF
ncbi:MAG: substrate-binding domain-containing protein [Asticcacaulis sp.]